MKDVLKNRKSIRKFKSDDIDNSVINELLSDAFYASHLIFRKEHRSLRF